ncbi:MAG: DoxX family protein [Muribaculaceae bacterium]|nr:DoxX family protein [Muribaculaceae bacterium]
MSRIQEALAKAFIRFTGYTYSNMARLFIRLFVGVMFMQFGIRHLVNFQYLCHDFPSILGMSSETCLILMIIVELICSLFIMAGFLTRLSTLPPILSMVAAEYYIVHDMLPHASLYGLDSTEPGYLPIMFIGIYLYILLAGPGKISLDYFITLFLLGRQGKNEEEELEEV